MRYQPARAMKIPQHTRHGLGYFTKADSDSGLLVLQNTACFWVATTAWRTELSALCLAGLELLLDVKDAMKKIIKIICVFDNLSQHLIYF